MVVEMAAETVVEMVAVMGPNTMKTKGVMMRGYALMMAQLAVTLGLSVEQLVWADGGEHESREQEYEHEYSGRVSSSGSGSGEQDERRSRGAGSSSGSSSEREGGYTYTRGGVEVRTDSRMGTTAGGGSAGERSGVIVAPAALPIRQGFSGELGLMEQKVQQAEVTLQAIKDAHRAGRFYTTDNSMPVITIATTVTQTVVQTPVIETNVPPPEPTYGGDGGGDGGPGGDGAGGD